MNVLVTGGLGYIGSHTVVELIESGHKPIIVDNLVNSRQGVLQRIHRITGHATPFYQIDIADRTQLSRIFEEHDIKHIIHFAALKSVEESVQKPLDYYRNNVASMIGLLETMQHYQVYSMVFSSSCTVYGEPDSLPVTESTRFKEAASPYGRTKQICEDMLADACAANQALRVISLRYFNPVGAHHSGLIGELPLGMPNNLMPIIAQTAAGIRDELIVYGNDYDTKDGTAIRDYIHVVDLAKSHVAALNRIEADKLSTNYETYNVGTGEGLTVLEMIKTFEEVNNVKVRYKIGSRRPGDIERIFADTSLANKNLGWKAELTLEDMVRSAWKWQQGLDKDQVE